MNGMNIELLLTLSVGFVSNLIIITAGYISMRERITRLETHLMHILGKLELKPWDKGSP